MPKTGAEPNKEQTEILARLAEERHVQKVVAEEGAEGDVPALPELRNGGAGERMAEVFVKVEAKHAAEADGNIGITAEVKVNIQRIHDDGVPCAEHGKSRDVLAEERVDDGPQIVRDDDLLRKAEDHAQRTFA